MEPAAIPGTLTPFPMHRVFRWVLLLNAITAVGWASDAPGRMAWFREAKYGLFLHWGLYAIPAGEWRGRPVRPSSEWIMAHARIPVREYEQLARQFDPTEFNAEQWVTLAQQAGMRYIVYTAKHGDGFAMYHSRVSRYNIYDATPFHRDPLRELAEACARHGIRLGIYYSQSVDWHEPGGEGNTWDFGSDAAKDASGAYDRFLREKCEAQVKELLTNYGPICEMFFDTPWRLGGTRGRRFAALVHSLQPACLIDGRLGVPGDYSTMGDNAIPSRPVPGDWESPGELNHNWGYDRNDADYKSPSEILFRLLDIVSKGGNYLLDVGPDALGRIPTVAALNLEAAGRWLAVNGPAVYGVRRSPFGEGYVKRPPNPGEWPARPAIGWRCTAAAGKLYFTIFNWPSGGFRLPPIEAGIRRAYLLADPGADLPLVQAKGARIVETPQYAPNVMATVLVVEIDRDWLSETARLAVEGEKLGGRYAVDALEGAGEVEGVHAEFVGHFAN